MTLQSCLKYDIGVDHVLPPETSCAFIKERALDLVDYLMKVKPEEFPFAQVVVSIPSRKFEQMVGPNVRPSGKGFSEIEATNSVLFEIAERYSNIESLKKKGITSTLTQLRVSPEEIYENFFPSQIETLHFPAIFPYTPMRWDIFSDIKGNVKPIPYLFYFMTLHGSNGIAAGNTLEEAILHGAYEVIERHCVSIVQETHVPVAPINRESVENEYLNTVPDLQLYDISFLDIPTILGILPRGDNEFFCIAGCAGTRTEALNRLLSETAQLNTYAYFKKQGQFTFKYYPTAMHTYTQNLVSNTLDPVNFDKIPEIARMDILEELNILQENLTKTGMTLYWKDNTGSLQVPSVVVFIQGAKMCLLPVTGKSFSHYKGMLV